LAERPRPDQRGDSGHTAPDAHDCPSTITTTLARLCEQGFVSRELAAGRKMPWVYTARYPSRSALLAGTFEQLVAQVGADQGDRAEALGLLLGVAR
jgi:hypothetical protein